MPILNRDNGTSFTLNMPHQAGWVVYINGIEIPVVDVDVDFGVWNVPSATLKLIPHISLQRVGFEDRLQVCIFYLDEFFDPYKPNFCLLGEFETVGWAYQNTATGRFLSLECRSQLQIFEQLRIYYMSSLNDMVVGLSARNATMADQLISTQVLYPASLFLEGLLKAPGTQPDKENFIKTPFQFVANILKALTAKVSEAEVAKSGEVPGSAAAAPGRNFFGRWMNMTDFPRRWFGLPGIDDDPDWLSGDGCFPLIKACAASEILNTIKQQIGSSIGNAGSLWELLQRTMATMLMEVNVIPAPPAAMLVTKLAVPASTFTARGKGEGETHYGGILSYMLKPQCIFGIPPAFNIVFPSMVRSFSFSENYMQQPTRLYMGEQYMTSVLSARSSADMQSLAQELNVTGYPEVVAKRMEMYIGDPKQNTRNFLLFPEELYKGPVSKHLNAPPWLFNLQKIAEQQGSPADWAVGPGARTYAYSPPKRIVTDSVKALVSKESNNIVMQIENRPGYKDAKMFVLNMTDAMDVTKNTNRNGPYIRAIVAGLSKYHDMLKGICGQFGVPFEYAGAIITAESGWSTDRIATTSSTNAKGFMQLEPDTFVQTYLGLRKSNPSLPPNADPFDPYVNMLCGVKYQADFLYKYNLDASDVTRDKVDPRRAEPSMLQVAVMGFALGNAGAAKLLTELVATEAAKTGTQKSYIDPKTGKYITQMPVTFSGPDAWRNPDLTSKGDLFDSISWNIRTNQGEYAKKSLPMPYWRYYSARLWWAWALFQEGYKQFKASGGKVTPASTPQAPTPNLPGTTAEGSAPSTTPTQAAAQAAGSVDISNINLAPSSPAVSALFKLYAKYEFFRSRFEPRTAQVTMAFDPYIVPGFSAVIFDDSSAGFHIMGYVTNVKHSFSASGNMATYVSLSYLRTFPEYIGLLAQGDASSGLLDEMKTPGNECAPQEPIQAVRSLFQDAKAAETFFNTVFYPSTKKQQSLVFRYKDMLEYYNAEGKKLDINKMGDWTVEDGLDVRPAPSYSDYFMSYDAAMSYVSRPATTLQQYIELWHGKTLKACLLDKTVIGPKDTFKAPYYARIYSFTQGPGDPKSEVIQKITNVGPDGGPVPDGYWSIIGKDSGIAQTRRNWDAMLIRYRTIVRENISQKG